MVIQNAPTLGRILLDAAICSNRKSYSNFDEPLTDSELESIAENLDLSKWNLKRAVYVWVTPSIEYEETYVD